MDHIVGQDRAIDLLQGQLTAGRVHHAQVFHGPAGVGKFTTALALTRVLLCHQPQRDLVGRATACGTCDSCRLIPQRPADPAAADDAGDASGGGHPDMHVVVKELARFSGEADVRARKQTTIPRQVLVERLIEPAYRAAQLGHGKVFIVDEAHLLGPDGQNALLKTLEEPPAGTTIMLVTDAVDRLLATVRSRSHLVPFVPLAEAQLEAWLDARARADPDSPAASLSDSQRAAVVRMSSGSPGLAALVLQRGLVEWLDAVSPMLGDLARGRTVPELGPALAERIDGYASQWVKDHPQASKEAANHRAAGLMGTLVQGCARAGLAAASAKAPADDPEAAWDRLGPWVRMIDAVVENQQLLSANVNTKHAAEDLGAQLNLAWSR